MQAVTESRAHRHWNVGLLDAVGAVILDVLRGPADRLAMLASSLRQPPPGPDWRPWPWLTGEVYPRIRTLSAEPDPVRLVGESARRLAESGSIEIACTPMRRCRPRIRFARAIGPALYAVEPEPLVVPVATERRSYEPVGGRVVDHVARHLLALLAEPVSADDERSMRVASCSRTPPDDSPAWRPWPFVVPRLVARAALAGRPCRLWQVVAWAAWRLSRAGLVVLATSPIRGSSVGQIRFARLAGASA